MSARTRRHGTHESHHLPLVATPGIRSSYTATYSHLSSSTSPLRGRTPPHGPPVQRAELSGQGKPGLFPSFRVQPCWATRNADRRRMYGESGPVWPSLVMAQSGRSETPTPPPIDVSVFSSQVSLPQKKNLFPTTGYTLEGLH